MDKNTQASFTFQPTLEGETIALRPLHQNDFDSLIPCASDKRIWEGHPSPDRYQLSAFTSYFKSSIESQANVVVID